ncbi:MAG: hypothetical protein JKY65_22390 [Planctomycetes bacterium]|nr:hypothetical protein [Planctomycetota bacterium]
MSLPRAADGRWGVRLAIPDHWSVLEDEDERSSWDCGGLAATLERWPQDVFVDGFLLSDFRQDLRLLAAERSGGLVACELRPGLSGVWGLTKEPHRRAEAGATYRAHLLIPTASGTLCLGALAHETQPAGVREAAVIKQAKSSSSHDPSSWSGDPYGFDYSPAPDASFPYWSFPPDLTLATEADQVDYDLLFDRHPLSRVRRLLDELELEVLAPSTLRVPRGRISVGSARFFRPLGFVEAAPTSVGEGVRYLRTSFGHRATALWVTHHPSGEGNLKAQAHRVWDQVLAAVPGGAVATREARASRAQACGRQPGVLTEYRLTDPDRYGVSCLFPWEDHLLEVHRLGPAFDWERANADVRAVIQSLASKAAPPRPKTAEGVTHNGLRRVYRVLSWFAIGDHDLDPAEARLLASLQREFGISDDEALSLARDARSGRPIPLGRRAAERDLLVRNLVLVVAADGIFDPTEARRLAKLAPRLDLDAAAVLRMIQDELE